MDGEMRTCIGVYGNRRRDYASGYLEDAAAVRGARSLADTRSAHAREKSLNFFAFRQQQMGNWPINCCDALGLPISAASF